jgi:hypothetical protein
MTFGEIFIIGVVVILVCVMLDEFLEAYDEYMNNDDES